MVDNVKPDENAKNEWYVLIIAVLASSMAFIDATALNVALPAIQAQLGSSGTELFWIVNAYAVVIAGLILFGGSAGDQWGLKRVFSFGIVLFIAASAACATVSDTSWMIITRSLQGLGAAFMIPGSLSMIVAATAPSRRGRAIGIWSACSVIMTALGPIVGGILVDLGWWRAVFLINIPIGIVTLGILATKVRSVRRRPDAPIDLIGAFLSVAGLATLNFSLLEATRRGLTDRWVVVSMLLGLACLVGFVAYERRAKHPLLPASLMHNRNLVAAGLMTVTLYSAFYGMLFFLALNLIQVQGYAARHAGLAQLPVMMLVMVLSPVAGSMADRFGPKPPLAIGGILGCAGFVALAVPGITSGPADYWTSFFPAMLLLGAAIGMSAAPLSSTVMGAVPPHQFGMASGINSALSRLSNVIGIATFGPIVLWSFRASLFEYCDGISLGQDDVVKLSAASWQLADATPPADLTPGTASIVELAIRNAFVDAFRTVSLISAVCIAISTAVTALLLRKEHPHD